MNEQNKRVISAHYLHHKMGTELSTNKSRNERNAHLIFFRNVMTNPTSPKENEFFQHLIAIHEALCSGEEWLLTAEFPVLLTSPHFSLSSISQIATLVPARKDHSTPNTRSCSNCIQRTPTLQSSSTKCSSLSLPFSPVVLQRFVWVIELCTRLLRSYDQKVLLALGSFSSGYFTGSMRGSDARPSVFPDTPDEKKGEVPPQTLASTFDTGVAGRDVGTAIEELLLGDIKKAAEACLFLIELFFRQLFRLMQHHLSFLYTYLMPFKPVLEDFLHTLLTVLFHSVGEGGGVSCALSTSSMPTDAFLLLHLGIIRLLVAFHGTALFHLPDDDIEDPFISLILSSPWLPLLLDLLIRRLLQWGYEVKSGILVDHVVSQKWNTRASHTVTSRDGTQGKEARSPGGVSSSLTEEMLMDTKEEEKGEEKVVKGFLLHHFTDPESAPLLQGGGREGSWNGLSSWPGLHMPIAMASKVMAFFMGVSHEKSAISKRSSSSSSSMDMHKAIHGNRTSEESRVHQKGQNPLNTSLFSLQEDHSQKTLPPHHHDPLQPLLSTRHEAAEEDGVGGGGEDEASPGSLQKTIVVTEKDAAALPLLPWCAVQTVTTIRDALYRRSAELLVLLPLYQRGRTRGVRCLLPLVDGYDFPFSSMGDGKHVERKEREVDERREPPHEPTHSEVEGPTKRREDTTEEDPLPTLPTPFLEDHRAQQLLSCWLFPRTAEERRSGEEDIPVGPTGAYRSSSHTTTSSFSSSSAPWDSPLPPLYKEETIGHTLRLLDSVATHFYMCPILGALLYSLVVDHPKAVSRVLAFAPYRRAGSPLLPSLWSTPSCVASPSSAGEAKEPAPPSLASPAGSATDGGRGIAGNHHTAPLPPLSPPLGGRTDATEGATDRRNTTPSPMARDLLHTPPPSSSPTSRRVSTPRKGRKEMPSHRGASISTRGEEGLTGVQSTVLVVYQLLEFLFVTSDPSCNAVWEAVEVKAYDHDDAMKATTGSRVSHALHTERTTSMGRAPRQAPAARMPSPPLAEDPLPTEPPFSPSPSSSSTSSASLPSSIVCSDQHITYLLRTQAVPLAYAHMNVLCTTLLLLLSQEPLLNRLLFQIPVVEVEGMMHRIREKREKHQLQQMQRKECYPSLPVVFPPKAYKDAMSMGSLAVLVISRRFCAALREIHETGKASPVAQMLVCTLANLSPFVRDISTSTSQCIVQTLVYLAEELEKRVKVRSPLVDVASTPSRHHTDPLRSSVLASRAARSKRPSLSLSEEGGEGESDANALAALATSRAPTAAATPTTTTASRRTGEEKRVEDTTSAEEPTRTSARGWCSTVEEWKEASLRTPEETSFQPGITVIWESYLQLFVEAVEGMLVGTHRQNLRLLYELLYVKDKLVDISLPANPTTGAAAMGGGGGGESCSHPIQKSVSSLNGAPLEVPALLPHRRCSATPSADGAPLKAPQEANAEVLEEREREEGEEDRSGSSLVEAGVGREGGGGGYSGRPLLLASIGGGYTSSTVWGGGSTTPSVTDSPTTVQPHTGVVQTSFSLPTREFAFTVGGEASLLTLSLSATTGASPRQPNAPPPSVNQSTIPSSDCSTAGISSSSLIPPSLNPTPPLQQGDKYLHPFPSIPTSVGPSPDPFCRPVFHPSSTIFQTRLRLPHTNPPVRGVRTQPLLHHVVQLVQSYAADIFSGDAILSAEDIMGRIAKTAGEREGSGKGPFQNSTATSPSPFLCVRDNDADSDLVEEGEEETQGEEEENDDESDGEAEVERIMWEDSQFGNPPRQRHPLSSSLFRTEYISRFIRSSTFITHSHVSLFPSSADKAAEKSHELRPPEEFSPLETPTSVPSGVPQSLDSSRIPLVLSTPSFPFTTLPSSSPCNGKKKKKAKRRGREQVYGGRESEVGEDWIIYRYQESPESYGFLCPLMWSLLFCSAARPGGALWARNVKECPLLVQSASPE